MQAITANEAKTQFGELLFKVQRTPIQIQKHGKPVAVVLSIQDYESLESLKLQSLKQRAAKADTQITSGQVVDGESVINELLLA